MVLGAEATAAAGFAAETGVGADAVAGACTGACAGVEACTGAFDGDVICGPDAGWPTPDGGRLIEGRATDTAPGRMIEGRAGVVGFAADGVYGVLELWAGFGAAPADAAV